MEVCPLVSCKWLGDVDFKALKSRFFVRWCFFSLITGGHSLLFLCCKRIFGSLDFSNCFNSFAKRIVSDDNFTLNLVISLRLEDYHLSFVLGEGVRCQHITKRHFLLNQNLLHHWDMAARWDFKLKVLRSFIQGKWCIAADIVLWLSLAPSLACSRAFIIIVFDDWICNSWSCPVHLAEWFFGFWAFFFIIWVIIFSVIMLCAG